MAITTGERESILATASPNSSSASRNLDLLRDIRRIKRLTQVGVYGALVALIPFDIFVLGHSFAQEGLSMIVALSVATAAMEGAFSQIFKHRKRATYPSILLLELGSQTTAADTAHAALATVRELLGVDASFIATIEDGDVQVLATDGIPPQQAQEYTGRIQDREMKIEISTPDGQSDKPQQGLLTCVPVMAWQRLLGVLGMVSEKTTPELQDSELMAAIGNAIGLSLENVRQRESLQEGLSLLTATLNSTADGIVVINTAGEIVHFNSRFQEMWSIPNDVIESGVGQNAISYVLPQLEDPDDFVRQINQVRGNMESETSGTVDFKDGRVFELHYRPHRRDGEIVGRVWSFSDITELRQSEETIRHLAYHDALTDLPNRSLFSDRLTVALAQARRTGQGLAIMFLDIDLFKRINDTLGHSAGDELLREIALELDALVREGDTVARAGGDEFTLLLTGVSDREEIETIAGRVLETVGRPRTISRQEVTVTTSIGVALFPHDGADAQTLLRNADTAMYRAKQHGRDNYQVYTPAMSAEIRSRVSLEAELRRATARGDFVVHYQPQIEAASGRITGAEALLRWNHEERGLVYPAEFIDVAEETGLIIPMGEWVLHVACEQNKRWQDAGLPPITIAVNLAARQFQQANLVDTISRTIKETSLDPSQLELEITEGTTIRDPDLAASVLRQLREMGVRVSIDDFGTGYSSLNYLKRFRIDRLKIDRSFVSDLITDHSDAAIATAMIAMAHSLGLTVVAEGVETDAQLDFLLNQGCDYFQGYLLGGPVPADEFEALLQAGARVDIPRRDIPLDVRDVRRPA